jgi:hypothetical protein
MHTMSRWLVSSRAAVAVAVLSGCGGPSASSAPSDSGVAADGCISGADLSSLAIPDAAIGDAGATVAGCYACVASNCQSQLAACSLDCSCSEEVAGLIPCIATGAPANSTKVGECLEALKGELGLAVAGCMLMSCADVATAPCVGLPSSD